MSGGLPARPPPADLAAVPTVDVADSTRRARTGSRSVSTRPGGRWPGTCAPTWHRTH